MTEITSPIRCAVYCRKSTDEGLDMEFNSLDAQREAGENFIASQKANGWTCLPEHYDDGGYSGGNANRPALIRLREDIEAGRIDAVIVYKIDRLSRSLLDFAELLTLFDRHHIAFVSVTQDINTSSSSGRMMLNILMTFAQFEREVITERIHDKITAAKKKGMHCGGPPPLGYTSNPVTKKLEIVPEEAEMVKRIFAALAKPEMLAGVMHSAAGLDENGKRLKLKQVQAAFADLVKVWDVMFPVEQYKFIRSIIAGITVYPDKVKIEYDTAGLEQIIAETEGVK